jgi:hypothetical protein
VKMCDHGDRPGRAELQELEKTLARKQ